jgi:spore coat protein U-like protein
MRLRLLAALSLLALPLATRADRCKIDTLGAIAFGQYNVFAAAPLDAIGSIGYGCSATPGPIVMLSQGSGSFATRTLRSGTSVLTYNVYLDAGRTSIFGDGTAGTVTFDGRNGRGQTILLYSRITPGQMVPPGAYTDTLVATLLF